MRLYHAAFDVFVHVVVVDDDDDDDDDAPFYFCNSYGFSPSVSSLDLYCRLLRKRQTCCVFTDHFDDDV